MVNQKIGHMVFNSQSYIYATENAFHGRLSISTVREHLCGFYTQMVNCVDSDVEVDSESGHTLCLACGKITVQSGLRVCDICDREYIDKTKHQNPNYETNCPKCVEEYEL